MENDSPLIQNEISISYTVAHPAKAKSGGGYAALLFSIRGR